MGTLQINDHGTEIFISASNEKLRFAIAMLSVNIKISDVEFDEKYYIINAGIDFNLLLEKDNYNKVKDFILKAQL